MSSGELLLTLLVALCVFGPNKLPMLANHLGKLVGRINHYKARLAIFWQQQLLEQQLEENNRKAKDAETSYQQQREQHESKPTHSEESSSFFKK